MIRIGAIPFSFIIVFFLCGEPVALCLALSGYAFEPFATLSALFSGCHPGIGLNHFLAAFVRLFIFFLGVYASTADGGLFPMLKAGLCLPGMHMLFGCFLNSEQLRLAQVSDPIQPLPLLSSTNVIRCAGSPLSLADRHWSLPDLPIRWYLHLNSISFKLI